MARAESLITEGSYPRSPAAEIPKEEKLPEIEKYKN